jgi:hypothetical protein
MTANAGTQYMIRAQMYKKIKIIRISGNNSVAFFVYISIVN